MVNSATFDTNSSIEQGDRNPVSRSSPRQKTISDDELPVNPLAESENSLLGENLAAATEEDKTLCCRVPLEKVQEVLTTFHQPKCEEPKPTRKLLCLYCERSFASANLRQKHVERIHSVKKNRRLSSRKQQLTVTPCIYCDKLNNSENTLNELFQHLVNEHSNKYFGCVECEERFLTTTLLHDHNGTLHPTVEIPKTTINLIKTEDDVTDVKLTRSRTKPKLDNTDKLLIRNKNAKLKELRSKKLTVKSSRLVFNRRESKRLQALAKITENQKKKRQKPIDRKQMNTSKPEAVQEKIKPTSICVNPYPEFDNFYRVKKITDHSIDNLKISSLTFDDVFDKAFFNRIKCNIEENLLHHIDGKLFKNEESESRISNFEKVSSVQQEIQNSTSENYGCELSLNAVTPVAALSLNSQFGEDFEYQIEYGSKPSKKKTQTKKDEVHYKYFTRRKFQASILEQKENRDLSKLDMWTQLVIKKRQQKIIDDKKSAKEMLEYTTGDEYKNKIMKEELNRILDRRGPFEDLREEASKKAALDKLNSASEDSISHESFTDIREVLNDILNRVFAATEKSEEEVEEATNNQTTKFCLKPDLREIPSFLNLRRTSSLPSDGELDQSDKITLICSSQETENFELPTNATRAKNELIELSGEWARCRMYICAACGAKLPNMKYLLDHKTIYHQNVWVQHYEFVGNQSELYRHLSIPALGKVGYIEDNVACKLWKRSDARVCSKCKKQCNSLGELHRHILECGGDWTWILVRKKCKYRYGAKSRRRRRGMVLKVRTKRKTDSTEKKINNKYDGPRQRPSDAETIQRMLANLPAKRSTRKLISLYDGVRRRQKTKELENVKEKKVKCGKVIYDKSSNIKETTEKTINTAVLLKKSQINNKSSNARCLRSLSRVLSSRILDTNTKLTVKRKLKVLNERRRTRQSEENKEKDDITDDTSQLSKETKKKTESTKEITPKRTSPRTTKMVRKMKLFAGNINIKSFFPVKKRKDKNESNPDKDIQTRSRKKSEEDIKEEKAITKVTKSDRLSTLVRSLSTNKKKNSKKTSQEKPSVDIAQEVEVPKKSASKEELELTRRKRKLKQSFQNVINRVKRLKIDAAPELQVQTQESQTSSKSPFLDDSKHEKDLPLKIVIPSNTEAKENIADISETAHTVIPFNETNEDSPVPEIIFKLDSNNEKSLQAKGEFHDTIETEIKLPTIQEPISIETSLKPKVVPLISPNMKGKIRKPARGLNDCIAMLTSKLQQKSTVDTVSTYPSANLPKIVTDPSPQIAECILKIPTFRTQKEPTEELALDLSTKSRNQEPENPIFGWDFKKLTSVERIIENVVNNKFQESHTSNPICNSIDQTIQNVIDGHLKQQTTVQIRTTIDNIIDYVINFNSTTENNLNQTLPSLKPKEKTRKIGSIRKVNKNEENAIKIVASEEIIEEETKEKIVKVSKKLIQTKRSKNKTESPETNLDTKLETNLNTKLKENNVDKHINDSKITITDKDEPNVLETKSIVHDNPLPNPIELSSSNESKNCETKSKQNLRNFRKQTKILICSEVKINNEISDNNIHKPIPEKAEETIIKEKSRKMKTKIIKKTLNEFEADKVNHEDCQNNTNVRSTPPTVGKSLIISYKTKRRRKRTKKLRFTQRKAKRLPVTYDLNSDQIDYSLNKIDENPDKIKENLSVLETNSTKSELPLTSDTANTEDKADEIVPAIDFNVENQKIVKTTILKPAVLSITSIMKIKKDEDVVELKPHTSNSIESETPVDKKFKKPKRKGRKSKRLTVPKRRTFKFLPLSDNNEIENLEFKAQERLETNNSNENVFENNKIDEENIQSDFTEIEIQNNYNINESISDNTIKIDNKQQKEVKKVKKGRSVKINKMLSNEADKESTNSELDNAIIENMTEIEKLLESEEGSSETKRKLPNRKSKCINKSEQPSNESLKIKRKLPDRKSKSIKKSTVPLNTSNIDCADNKFEEINETEIKSLVEDVEEKLLNTNVKSVSDLEKETGIVNKQKTRLRRSTRSLENLNAACDEDMLLLDDKKIDLTRSLENLNVEVPENIDLMNASTFLNRNPILKKSTSNIIATIEHNKIPHEDVNRSKEDISFLKKGIESLDNLEPVKNTPLLETSQHIEDNLKSETFPDTSGVKGDLNLKERSEETILVRKGRPKGSKLFKKEDILTRRPNSAKTLTQRSNSAISPRLTKFKRKITKSASLENLNTVTKNFGEKSIISNEIADLIPEFNLESKVIKEPNSEETKNIVIKIDQPSVLNEDKKLEDDDSVFQDEIRRVPNKSIKDNLPKDDIPKVKPSECIIRRTRSSNNIMTSSNESLSKLNDSLDAEVSKIMGYSELTNYQKISRYSKVRSVSYTNSSESESSPRKSKRLGRKSRKSSNTFSSEESMNNSGNATPSDLPDGDFVSQKSIRPLRKSKLIKNVVTNGDDLNEQEVIDFSLINNTEGNSNSNGSDIKLLEEKIRNAIRNSLITMSESSTLDKNDMSLVTTDSNEEIKYTDIIDYDEEPNRNETNKKLKKSKKTNNRLSEISDVSNTSTEVSSSRSLRRKSVINYAEIEESKEIIEPSENLDSETPITDLLEINNSTVINEASNEDIEEEESKRLDNLEVKSQENSYILKENLSKNTLPQIKNGMNKKRTKLRAKKGKRRFIRNQKSDVTIPEVEPTTLLENIISDSTIPIEVVAEKEPPIKIIINKHKARRKSKSIKKISLKGHNDLYEDFALVIKKKRRAPIITFSPPDTFSKEDTYPMEVHHVQKVTDLVDSVEEVDMELEELPIKTNIIETTKLDLLLPDCENELKNEEIIQTKVGGRKKRGKSRVNRKKSSPRTIANSILNEEIPVLKLNLNTQDSYSSDIVNNTSTSITSEIISNFVLDKDDFSSDDFEVDNSFEDSIICDDDTPKKPSVDADTLFDKLIESSETLKPLILKKNKILKKKGGKKIKNRTQFEEGVTNADSIDNLLVTANIIKDEFLKPVIKLSRKGRKKGGRAKWKFRNLSVEKLIDEELDNLNKDTNIIVALSKEITEIENNLSFEDTQILHKAKPDELKKDDIDKLYAFSETEDFELELPRRLLRKNEEETNNINITEKPEVSNKKYKDEDIPIISSQKPEINFTSAFNEETKVSKRKSKDDDIPMVSDDSAGRKSMRSAKVKALESIHDEALAELTDIDKIAAIDSECKKSIKRGKKTVNNFDLSNNELLELKDIDIINDNKSTKIATIDFESKKSNKKGKKVISNFDLSVDAMVNNDFPELTDINISDDKKTNTMVAFDSESKKLNKKENKVINNFDFSTNNEFPELTDIGITNYKKIVVIDSESKKSDNRDSNFDFSTDTINELTEQTDIDITINKKTNTIVAFDSESKKSNKKGKKINSNFDFSTETINNELLELRDIDITTNKKIAIDSENKKSNKKWKKINSNFDFANKLLENEIIKINNEEQNDKKLTKKQKKTEKYLHLTESFDIPREVLSETPLLEDLVAELDGLEELENSIERELNAENEKECKEPLNSNVAIEENQELRRSRRGSRKITSYNENDLIDPLINVLENIKVVKKKEDKATLDAKKKKEAERKLNSEQLFDLLKASTNDNLYVPKQPNSFLNNLEDSSRDVTHENFENMFENMLENTAFLTQKKSDIDKIYEFTDNNDESKAKIIKSKKLEDIESSQDYTSDSKSRSDNYCEICNKSFVKLENLIKHRRTLTHIQKLSEIEAKEAEKSKIISRHEDENSIESVIVPPSLPSNSEFERSDLKIDDILINKDNIQSPFNTNHSLKLADIISDVLNKPVLPDMDKETNTFSDIILQNDTKRYKSLGERKSFDSDSLITSEMTDSFEPKTTKTILEKQISLLENIIENQTTINYIDDISLSTDKSDTPSEPSSPIVSKPMINNDSFLKPTQYEEISEDSANVRNYDDQKLRKTLNRDEELFLECCSLLKSSSEVSSSYSNKKIHEKVIGALGLKPMDEPEWMEKKNILYENNSNAIDYSDNSRIPTPLGNSYDDEASNSNTISSNWGMDKSADAAASRFSFKNVTGLNNEDDRTKFEGLLSKNRAEIVITENATCHKSNHGELSEGSFNDNKKIMTKGARKVFEGLKVSIPTEELNMEEVLNNSPKLKKTEMPIEEEKLCSPPSKRKSKPVKKAQVGSNLLFKVNKKKLPSPSIPKEQQDDKGYDVYDFEETQDNTDAFTKPNYREFRTLKAGENESEGENPEELDQFVQPLLVVKKTKAHENITKKKCMIMGRIFKNAAKSKIEDIDEEIRTIPVIDNEELVENYVAECKKVITSKNEWNLPKKEIDQVVEDKVDLEKDQKQIIKTFKKQDIKRKTKLKGKKRLRTNSDSTDDEFSLCKTVKRKTNRKNAKEEDNCINLEQELKECIGVASRKSQRKCTSGKQNVLVEYWSSDESQFEALLEKQIIEIKPKLPPIEKPVKSIETEVPPVIEAPVETKKKKSSEKKINKSQEQLVDGGSSNRRKRAAVNPLYHWSSSSEDEANDLIEVKPLRDEIEDDEDRPVQHGWIVGDSPKKLVTMLAQAKGKKADIDCVKEQGKKRTNPVS